MILLLLLLLPLLSTHSQSPPLGILRSNRAFALELHRRCNPDDPISEHPKQRRKKDDSIPPPAWRSQWNIESIDFPCLDNTAPGIECEVHYDATPGKVGDWYQITSIQLPSFGLRCFAEIIVTSYRLEHLHTLDL